MWVQSRIRIARVEHHKSLVNLAENTYSLQKQVLIVFF